MKQSHQDNSISQPQPVRREFAVLPDNPTLFLTDDEIRARLDEIRRMSHWETREFPPSVETYDEYLYFLLSLIAARLPALVDEARR